MESPQMYDNQNNVTSDIKKITTMAAQNNTTTNNSNNASNNNNNNSTINQNLKQTNQLHNHPLQNGGNLLQKQQQQILQQQHQNQQIQQHQYSQNDLEELTSQEISLDLAHLIDDQFRDQESLALFSEIVPTNANGVASQTAAAVKVLQLQQARLNQRQNQGYSQLAYMPQAVHTGIICALLESFT